MQISSKFEWRRTRHLVKERCAFLFAFENVALFTIHFTSMILDPYAVGSVAAHGWLIVIMKK